MPRDIIKVCKAQEWDKDELKRDRPDLWELAIAAEKATKGARPPYTDFSVGAAVRTSSNKIYTGSNIENDIQKGTHAEMVAAHAAMHAEMVEAAEAGTDLPDRVVKQFATSKVGDQPVEACGACLQEISEYVVDTSAVEIVLTGTRSKVVVVITGIPNTMPFGYDLQRHRAPDSHQH